MDIRGEIEVFPTEVQDLLRGLASKNFFVDGILCGSWTMLVYRRYNKLAYTLRTDDIDFAVEMARPCVASIPAILDEHVQIPPVIRPQPPAYVSLLSSKRHQAGCWFHNSQ
jgi:hypothetical protein